MTTTTQERAIPLERLRMPDGRQMTQQEYLLREAEQAATRAVIRRRLLRAILAIFVMGAGLGLAVSGAWLYDWRAGLIVLGAGVTALGALLGYLNE